jgi:glycosyltransferase involved in cell wall biosynthesis
VLTVEPKPGDVCDESLLGRLPSSLRIVRTDYFDVARWERHATQAVRSLIPAKVTPARRAGDADPVIGQPGGGETQGLLSDLAAWFRVFAYFPDYTAGWLPFGICRAIELYMSEGFDAIYTSSPPKTAAVIGLALKRLFGVPWVCEFRDPWYPPQKALRQWMERRLQTKIVRHSDRIVLISEGNAEDIRKKFGLPMEKVAVVPNGYAEEDFQERPSQTAFFEPGSINLSHFGTVYPTFAGEFYPALLELLQDKPALRRNLRVNIIGFADDRQTNEYAQGELKDVMRLYPFIPHLDSLQAMRESDGLLLFLANERTSRLSGLGKIYWYLRAGKPVFAVAPVGGTRTLVEEGQAGWAVMSRAEIKSALSEFVQRATNGHPYPAAPREFVEKFRYDKLAGQLARVLDEVVML